LLMAAASAVQAEPTGGVVLRWTAPGNDNYVGTAAGYLIQYQPQASGPLDTQAEWAAATVVANVPFPSPAYSRDSVMILELTAGTKYYFALRTFDDVGNMSVLSNSPLVTAVSMDCCTGKVGNVNGLGTDEPTISDISMLIDNLFISGRPLWCVAEADINQSGGTTPQQGTGGDITIADISALIDHLFISGRALPNCL
jgi:hypothetical protein